MKKTLDVLINDLPTILFIRQRAKDVEVSPYVLLVVSFAYCLNNSNSLSLPRTLFFR
jgi:hypothetical protein